MKKLLLLLIIIAVVLLFAGCKTDVVPDLEQSSVKIIGIEQEYKLVGYKDSSILRAIGYKCPPECPDCDSCCPNCPDCPSCDFCCDCEECEICEECPDCPTCPTCPCYKLEWGDLYVNLEFTNNGDWTKAAFGEIGFLVRYLDETELQVSVDVDIELGLGETWYEQIEIDLPEPEQRVVFVELL